MSEDTLTGTLTGIYMIATIAEEQTTSEKPRQAYKLSRLLENSQFETQVYELMHQIQKMPGTAQTLYHILNERMQEVVTSPTEVAKQAFRIRRGKPFLHHE